MFNKSVFPKKNDPENKINFFVKIAENSKEFFDEVY